MENVCAVAVSPIGEQCLVSTGLLNRCIIQIRNLLLKVSARSSLTLINFLILCLQVHLMGVYDFGLFFEVERFFMVLSECGLPCELLLIVGDCHRGVRVSNEVVHASYLLTVLVVPNWQLINYRSKWRYICSYKVPVAISNF